MKCLIFFDKENIAYLDTILNYRNSGYCISKMYYIGPREDVINLSMIDIVGNVDNTIKFDVAIILCEVTDELINHLSELKIVNNAFDIWGLDEIEKNLLTKEGLMYFIEHKIKLDCPEVIDNSVYVGKCTYYEDISLEKERNEQKIRCNIGSFCSIAPGLRLVFDEWGNCKKNSIYPFDKYMCIHSNDEAVGKEIIIGNDVWIGANAIIMSGAHIGDGCIIGAMTVVSGEIEPYNVVIGNPGKIIRKRFSKDKIDMLLEMKWWNWKYKDLSNALSMIQSGDCNSLYHYYLEQVK